MTTRARKGQQGVSVRLPPAADMPCGCWLSGPAKLLVFQQVTSASSALSITPPSFPTPVK